MLMVSILLLSSLHAVAVFFPPVVGVPTVLAVLLLLIAVFTAAPCVTAASATVKAS